ncbi:MAG: hypothetical protein HY423_13335 [Candidatus Lambdaproteobacteria bacterium]|nr:hypothetical protein [Candidatus Lambdaproteobacteria bacterium]
MVINDLRATCPQCGGSGRQAGITTLGVSQINPGGRCLRCRGRGFVLTELGEDLIRLLRPFIDEAIAEHAAKATAPGTAPRAAAREDPS